MTTRRTFLATIAAAPLALTWACSPTEPEFVGPARLRLHARNRTDLIRYAIRKGIVRLESVEEAEKMLANFGGDVAVS